MSINQVSLTNACGKQAAIVAAIVWTVSSCVVFAQTSLDPVPLARPYGLAAPMASPYGLAPMPIGPAPYPAGFGQPTIIWQGYPQMVYPVAPYWGRPASPFDATGAAYPNPRSVETFRLPNQSIDQQAILSPIGNLRLTISQTFLNRLIARDEQKPGEEVRDFILGADVSGHQTTETKLHFNLIPSLDKMQGAFVLNGVTQSQTKGVTPQAMVDVASQQKFMAVKEIYFDGISFSTRHATVHVQAQNQTLGAITPLSGTLLGGIADRIAFREAERRKPAAEAVARDRVVERVYPEFDSQIDKQLATANDQLEGVVRRKLRELKLMPSRQQVSSTDAYVSYSAQLADELPMASTSSLERQVLKEDGVCLLVHESLLNCFVANSGLKGLKTTDKEIIALFSPYEFKGETAETRKPESGIALPGMENMVTNIEFDDNDPLTIRIEQDRMLVILRASFKPAGQDLLPPLIVTIPYETELIGDKIHVRPGEPRVEVQQPKDDGDMTQGIAMKLTKQGIEASLMRLALDRALPAFLWPAGGAAPQVTGIRSDQGWAAITIR